MALGIVLLPPEGGPARAWLTDQAICLQETYGTLPKTDTRPAEHALRWHACSMNADPAAWSPGATRGSRGTPAWTKRQPVSATPTILIGSPGCRLRTARSG